jgi:SWI/SNF-related matrix-associated actin-dependent regulator 1 of chromatin subfamily A
MPFIKAKCPQCGKVAETSREFMIGDKSISLLKCNHLIEKAHLNSSTPEALISLDHKKLFPFQCDGVRFIEGSSGRALVGDEMGLGKTVQALATMALHPKEMLPFLWIGKSSLKYQYQHEVMRWMGEEAFAQVIDNSKDVFLPGMTGYIVSYDLLGRYAKRNVTEDSQINDLAWMSKQCARLKIKTVILDECQQIKNSTASRTIYTRAICKDIPNVIALSGTPIKNNAGEYFTILNIIRPEMFPNESKFKMHDCDSYFDGYSYKVGGLRNAKAFMEKTKSFIIRRERAEVLPDLPLINRQFIFCELDKKVEKAYVQEFKEFRDDYNSNTGEDSFEEAGNILARLSRLRHLTGLSKIDACIDNTMEFLGSTDRKRTIFVHHKDVGEILFEKLSFLLKELELEPPLSLTASLDAQQRFNLVQEFTDNPKRRILIASTLASGEGLNLQICSNCVMLERQWNPANEEQAEGRFPRPGQTADSIDAIYFVAIGTVDEFFSEIVERKREIVNSTLSGNAVSWDQSSLMKELSETLAANGGRKWSI